MKIIGFNFTKISAEKMDRPQENINVQSNIDISDISKVQSELFSSNENLIGVKFNHTLNYEPNFAKISFSGLIILSFSPEESSEVLESWKEKKISDKFKMLLFNLILKKVSLRSLQLEEELNIPHHVQMPSVKFEDKK